MEKNKHILCGVAGRSGGHILPCLTFIQNILKKNDLHNGEILFFTTNHRLDTALTKNMSHTIHTIALPLKNIPFRKPWLLPLFFIHALRSFFIALYSLYHYNPQEIISTGGYIALPVCLAAKLLHIPITLFELNVHPGKASALLAPYCSHVHTCFKKTEQFLPNVSCTQKPYPLRFTQEDTQTTIPQHLKNLNFKTDYKTILIVGGSQGAQALNQFFFNNAQHFKKQPLQILHQTGHDDTTKKLKKQYKKCGLSAYVFSFEQAMAPYYALADVIICRSGAGTLFEVDFFKKLCITIPLETKQNNHQVANAQAFVDEKPNRFIMIRQKEMLTDPKTFITRIVSLLHQPKV